MNLLDESDLPENIIGLVFGPSSTMEFSFVVNPENAPKFGEFIVTKNRDGEEVLGIVKELNNINKLITSEEFSFESLVKNLLLSREIIEKNDIVIATARVLGVIHDNGPDADILPNRTPIKPCTPVKLASDETLIRIFRSRENCIDIGYLMARDTIPVGLDVRNLVLRHFAILAVTGSGKSNTTAVLINEIVKKMNGTVILIDPHGEYINYTFEDGSTEKKRNVATGIRPETLEPWEFASLVGISENAPVQRLYLERMFTTAYHEGRTGKDFIERILDLAEEWANSVDEEITYYDIRGNLNVVRISKRDPDSIARVRDYVNRFYRIYGDLLTQNDMLADLRPGYLNVIDLSGYDENQMRIIVAYLLRHILIGRIRYMHGDQETKAQWRRICPAIIAPMLVIVEEGHILAPKGEYNEVVRWMSKIAREGRKFGVGLGIISQRPKKLNDDILSQCNTKIILKIVEPNDQRYVQQASEQISEDLLKDIAALGRGEAVIVGSAVKVPVAVKIRKFGGEYGGQDIDVIKEWRMLKEPDVNLEDLAR